MFLNITSTSGSIRRGVKKWMTKQEIADKLGPAVADFIVNFKYASNLQDEIRDHPDAPGCEASL